VCLVVAGVALAGCGGTGGPGVAGGDADVTLLLGARPAGLHAGIYLAAQRGYDQAEGIDLTVRRTGDAQRLLSSGRVQAALLDAAEVEGAPVVCVMALTQTPRPDHFVCVTRTALADRRPEVEALVRTLQRGYSEAEVDPESAVQAILAGAGGLDRAALAAQLDAVSASFEAGVPAFGYLEESRLPEGDFDASLVGPVSRD